MASRKKVSFRPNKIDAIEEDENSYDSDDNPKQKKHVEPKLKPKQSELGIPSLFGSASTQSVAQLATYEEKPYLSPEEYFKQNLDDNLLCFKCHKLFTDPISCYKCGKVYCLACLDLELNDHSRCLYCFNVIFKELAEQNNDDFIEKYDKNEIKCPYRMCQEVVKLNDIRQHIEDCVYRDDEKKIEHTEKIIYPILEKDHYLVNHLLRYYRDLYSSNKEKPNLQEMGTVSIKTMSTNKTKSQRSSVNQSMTQTKMNRISRMSISKNPTPKYGSPTKKRNTLNNSLMKRPKTFLTNIGFVSRVDDLKSQLEYTNDYISKSVLELANKAKDTNEKLKTMVNI